MTTNVFANLGWMKMDINKKPTKIKRCYSNSIFFKNELISRIWKDNFECWHLNNHRELRKFVNHMDSKRTNYHLVAIEDIQI
jgi:hypothetical protein